MAISVTCPNCQRRINAAEKFAGKRARCPNCSAAIEVPAAGAGAAPCPGTPAEKPPPLPAFPKQPHAAGVAPAQPTVAQAALPQAPWWVSLSDGRQVGPLTQAALDQAVQMGQLTAACQVWQQGWPQPRWASELYPALAAPPPTVGGYAFPGASVAPYGGHGGMGGFGGAGQLGTPHMLGLPSSPYAAPQAAPKPKKKRRRSGNGFLGEPSDGRGFVIVVVVCAVMVILEIIGTASHLLVRSNAANVPDAAAAAGNGPERRTRYEAKGTAAIVVRWILTLALVAAMILRKNAPRWITVALFLFASVCCGPVLMIGLANAGIGFVVFMGMLLFSSF